MRYLGDLASSGVRSGVASGAESAPEVQAAAEVPVAAAISLSPVDTFTSEGVFFWSADHESAQWKWDGTWGS